MALKKLIFKPGINRDTTNYAQGSGSPDGQGGWYSANKIRFLSGFPQKLGGWKLYSTGATFAGVVRTLFNWAKDAYNLLAVGTNTNVFVEYEGVYHNITPLRATFVSPDSDNCFSTVSDAVIAAHPTWIKVVFAPPVALNANAGDTVIFSGAVGFAGIPASTLNAAHIVLEDLDLLPYNANYFYIDVGPLPTPALTDCFSTVVDATITLNPTWIKVLLAGAYANSGGTVIFSGAVGFAGIPTGTLNAAHPVLQGATYDPDFFYIDVGLTPTPGLTGGGAATTAQFIGGGTAITVEFEVGIGGNVAYSGGGWGAPSWGGDVESPKLGWGDGSLTPIFLQIRIVYFDKFTNDLFFNYRYSGPNTALFSVPQSMYRWLFPNPFTFADRAESIADAAAAAGFSSADVPPEVTQILFDDNSNTLMAFGCNPYALTAQPLDPLLIRWASQADYLNWTPSDDIGISTAGYLRIQSGSNILQAVSNAKEILVFTESSITSVQYTYSYPNLFSQTLISANISLFAPRAVIAINNTLYWMGRDKFYIYNGRAEALDCTLTLHVFDNLNFDQSDQCFAVHVEKYLEVWWFYCSGSSTVVNSYVVYKYDDNIWYYGNCDDGFVRTGWSPSPLRPFPQAAEPTVVDGVYTGTSRLYNHESGVDAGLLPMTSYIQSADIDLPESGERFVLLKRIIPDMSFDGSEGSPYVNFTIAPRNFPGSPYMTENQENEVFPRRVNLQSTVVLDQFTEQVFVRARARQMAIAVSSDTLGTHWSLGAVRADVAPDGRRGIGAPPGVLLAGRCVNGADTCVGAVSTFNQGLTVVGVQASGQIGFVGDNGPPIPDLLVSGVQAIGENPGVVTVTTSVPVGPLLRLDAEDPLSYPGTGDIWYDLTANSFDTPMYSNTVYDASGGGAPAMKFANPPPQYNIPVIGILSGGVIQCSSLGANQIYVGSIVYLNGDNGGGTGSFVGYPPVLNCYYVIATNGTTEFTLSETAGGTALDSTAGSGVDWYFNYFTNSYARIPGGLGLALSDPDAPYTELNVAFTFDLWVKFSSLSSLTAAVGATTSSPLSQYGIRPQAMLLDGTVTPWLPGYAYNTVVKLGGFDGSGYIRAGLSQTIDSHFSSSDTIWSFTDPWAPLVDRWYNITMVNINDQTSPTAIKLYVDGVLIGTGRALSGTGGIGGPGGLNGILTGNDVAPAYPEFSPTSINLGGAGTAWAQYYATTPNLYPPASIEGWIAVVNADSYALTAGEIATRYAGYSSRFVNLPPPAAVLPALYGTPIALYDTAISDYGQYGDYSVGDALFAMPTAYTGGNGVTPTTPRVMAIINQIDYTTTPFVLLNNVVVIDPASNQITFDDITSTVPRGLVSYMPIVVTGTNVGTGDLGPTYVSGTVYLSTSGYAHEFGTSPGTSTKLLPSPANNYPNGTPLAMVAGTLTGLTFKAYPNINSLAADTGGMPFYTASLPPAVGSDDGGAFGTCMVLQPSQGLQDIFSGNLSFSVNVWYYHTGFPELYSAVISQISTPPTVIFPYQDSDVGMFIGNVSGGANTICAAMWNEAAGLWASTTATTATLNTWYNYTMTYVSGSELISFYRNGAFVGSVTRIGVTLTQTTPPRAIDVNSYYRGHPFDRSVSQGKMGALQIYDVALNAAQVTQNWDHFRTRYGV